METIEQRKQKALAEMVEQAEKQPSKEIKTKDFVLCYSSTCFGFNGYYITDKISKWCELFAEKDQAKEYLQKRYGKPTTAEKIAEIMEFLTANNLNYTKKQYDCIMELDRLIKGGQNGVRL